MPLLAQLIEPVNKMFREFKADPFAWHIYETIWPSSQEAYRP